MENMEVLIVMILGLLLLVICGVNRGEAVTCRTAGAERRQASALWQERFTDAALEQQLRAFIADESNHDRVRGEVERATKTLSHSRYIRQGLQRDDERLPSAPKAHAEGSEWMTQDRAIALDVMLADRGKVSCRSATTGYSAVLSPEYGQLNVAEYEFAEWLMQTLHRQNVMLSLKYQGGAAAGKYVWEGSPADAPDPDETEKAFSRELIAPPKYDIPKAYYET